MPLDPAIVAGIGEHTQRTTFIVELQTAVVRRWTNFRTNREPRGLTVDAQFYMTANVTIPGIDEIEGVAPVSIELVIGNADNLKTELVSDPASMRKVIIVKKVHFNEDRTIRGVELWFEGLTGRPGFRGESVVIQCRADFGRRGVSPKTDSLSLMHSHTPPSEGAKLEFKVWSGS